MSKGNEVVSWEKFNDGFWRGFSPATGRLEAEIIFMPHTNLWSVALLKANAVVLGHYKSIEQAKAAVEDVDNY